MQEIIFTPVRELAAAIKNREVSAREVLDAHLEQIRKHNPSINAVVTIDEEGAQKKALEADEALARGETVGPLHGVPLTLKDSHCVAGMRTTAGYPPLENFVPQRDGTVAARLKRAGAIIIGKTNVPELLCDFQSDNHIFGRTNNPWDPGRTPGGSSGGACAAVSSGMVPFEIGSDLAGSIRVPSHFCGVYGIKTTEHRVSMAGHIPDLPENPRGVRILNTIGPLARNVDDLFFILNIIAGADGRDPDVPPVPLVEEREPDIKRLRVAWAPTFPGVPIAAEIRAALESFAAELSRMGAAVEERLPAVDFKELLSLRAKLTGYALRVFQPQEAHLPPITMADYFTALDRRDDFILSWERFFDDWDVLLCPPAMTTAFKHIPMNTHISVDGESVPYWNAIRHSGVFNFTGHPSVVIPIAKDNLGLPIGIQVVGRKWSEGKLLAAASLFAEMTPGFQRPPGY